MKLVFYCLLFTALFNPSLVFSKTKKKRVNYRPKFFSQVMSDKQTSATIFGTAIDFDFHYLLGPSVTAQIRAGLLLESGSNNSLNLKEFSPDQEVYLEEASFEIRPFDLMKIKIGSLSLKTYNSPLLLGQNVFMGVTESFSFFTQGLLQFDALQSIPNNQTLSSRSGGIEEGTPLLLMERVKLNLEGDLLSFYFSIGHFKFNNLSSTVANQSRFMGNDVGGGSSLTSYFLYKFEGYNSTFGLTFNQKSYFKVNINGQFLHNTKAPDGQSSAYLANSEIHFKDFGLGFSYFRNERNSSPAYYNSKYFGHNNKKGYALHFTFFDILDSFLLEGRWAQFKLIDRSSLLISDGNLLSLNLTKKFQAFY